jgi:hypothetical protein
LEGLVRRHVLFQVKQQELARANDALLNTGSLQRLLPDDEWRKISTALRSFVEIVRALVRASGAASDDGVTAFAITSMCDRVSVWYRPDGRLSPEALAGETWALVAAMLASSTAASDIGRAAG